MTNQSNSLPRDALFKSALFDVEHALDMYAFDYCTIPAEGIYDNEALGPLMSVIESCHIYLIGYTPIINLVNQLVTVFNPFAKNKDEGGTRITSGLEKLFNTTEEERVSLYEAALIRYFYPEFNKEFKDSFPSTKLKILQDCYKKDLSTVIAEICIDGLPFRLCSEKVSPKLYHIAQHDLHKSEARRMFFGL